MTNEEALEILKSIEILSFRDKKRKYFMADVWKAKKLAIKALEQQPCEDCISRQAVMKCFKKWQPYMATRLWDYEQELKDLPSATPTISKMEQVEDCVARSEALDILDDFEEDVENGKFKTAYAKARERMCELPPVTPSYNSIKPELKPSEDCISRQYLIERATSWDKHFADSERCVSLTEIQNAPSVTPKASEQQPSREWKEIYAESEGSNSWIEFKCPHCGYSFGMESGEYDWHYGDEIPWKYCPICGGSAQHKPYKTESEDKNDT